MQRAHTLLLIGLAFGLVARGVAPRDASALDSAEPRARHAAQIAAVVGAANPHLSDVEQQRISRAVLRSSRHHSLDPQLVTAIILVESGARPWVQSPKGAVGLMQVMPHMAEPLELAGNLTTIESNIEAGCSILADNIRRLGEEDGISAYFWGSDIRGGKYLERVEAARDTVLERVRNHRPAPSGGSPTERAARADAPPTVLAES